MRKKELKYHKGPTPPDWYDKKNPDHYYIMNGDKSECYLLGDIDETKDKK